MWPESNEHAPKLRTGLTTGTCATAACVAAAHWLLGNKACAKVSVTLPSKTAKAKVVELSMQDISFTKDIQVNKQLTQDIPAQAALAATIKDAGDDPDVTHGARVWVKLALQAKPGIQFVAGQGVGTVTRQGLKLAVGEPAINPVPRQMMTQHLTQMADSYAYKGGFWVQVGIDKGEVLAQKTMNGRLGIMGGLSILGTTGIVRPFSCAAWIASIHQGVDVATTNGYKVIGAATGNASEAYIKQAYQLEDMQLIEMGDFAGGLLKYLRQAQIRQQEVSQKEVSQQEAEKKQAVKQGAVKQVAGKQDNLNQVLLCGGIGKLSKLAKGHLDLHSSRSAIDFNHLAQLAQQQGADADLCQAITRANTCGQSVALCQAQGINLAQQICLSAWQYASQYMPQDVSLKVIGIDAQGHWLAETN